MNDSVTPAGAASRPQPTRPIWAIMAVLMIVEAVVASSTAMPLPALPAWLRLYGDPIAVGWIMTAYLLVAASCAALCGSLGDRFGRKRVIIAILIVVMTGSIVSAVSDRLDLIILGRCLQGPSGALMPLLLGLSRETLPPQRVALGFGLIIASGSFFGAISYPVAGHLIDTFGPSSIFWALAALCAVGLVGTIVILPGTAKVEQLVKIDWLGGILFAPGVALILMAVSSTGRGGLMGQLVIPMVVSSAVLLIVWYRHESRHPAPLIDVGLLKNRHCLAAYVLVGLLAVGGFQMAEVGALLLQQPRWTGAGLALTATVAGFVKLPAVATGAASSALAGWVTDRIGPLMVILVCGVLAGGAALVAIAFHETMLQVFIVLMLVSASTAAIYSVIPVLVTIGAPLERTSEALGVMAVVRATSQGIGAQLLAVILASSTISAPGSKVRFPDQAAYGLSFGYIAATFGAIVLIAWFVLGGSARRGAGGRAGSPRFPQPVRPWRGLRRDRC